MKNLTVYLVMALIIFLSNTLAGQTNEPVNIFGLPIIRCGTVEAEEALYEQFPNRGTIEEFEKWLAPKLAEYEKQKSNFSSVKTLPIVFHVIHNGQSVGSGANLNSDLIYAQLVQLNNDFRKVSGTSGDNNHPSGADTDIEFCPAAFDPSGNPLAEPGINRIDRNDMGWSVPGYSQEYIQSTIKPASQWDPDKYINVWVLQLSGTLLGYAQFPDMSGLTGLEDDGGAANTDGVVVRTSSVGSTELPNPGSAVYGAGRTLTHELGHFFGLRHIWGGGAGCSSAAASFSCACSLDDFCDDTPNAGRANYGCPNAETCESVDMKENYMDYTDDVCMNIFTQDQKARMQVILTVSPRRAQLVASGACIDVLAVTCPGNITRNTDPSLCGAIVDYPPAVGSAEVISITYSHNSGMFFPVGSTVVTATGSDINGITTACNFTITVQDLEAPTIICPFVTTSRNTNPGVCTYTAQGSEFDALGTDNCPGATRSNSLNGMTTLNGYEFPIGDTDVIWTMTDAAGNTANCVITITVTDNEPPTINCFDGLVTFNGEEEFILDVDDYTTYDDNCGIQSVVLDIPVITCEDLGEILVITATATDIYGNTADCTFNLEVQGLPCGWSFSPDGINCTGGNDVSYSVPLDEFYVESTNCFFGHPFNSDAMGFAQYELCGNGTITAHVTDISGNGLGWAGVAMRENNDAGSKKVQLLTNRSNLSRREVRTITNGTSFPQQFMSFNRYWLRLTRNGNQFTGHVSPNGVNWIFVMAANVTMPSCIEIGLVVTNYNSNSTVTSTFANVTVDEAMPKPVSPFDEVRSVATNEPTISVFPNPTTNGELYIDLAGFQQESIDIITLDPLGRIVGNKKIDSVQDNLEIMSLRDFARGVYYLKFIGNNGLIQVQKVIYSGN